MSDLGCTYLSFITMSKNFNSLSLGLFCFMLFFPLQNCDFPEFEGPTIAALSKLKIEGSSKIIYWYSAWGDFDYHDSGYCLMDSTQTFSLNCSNKLPFHFFSSTPIAKTISGVSHVCDRSCGKYYEGAKPKFKPLKVDKINRDGINIDNLVYQYKGYSKASKGYENLTFDSFEETRDSIFFYNLDTIKIKNKKHYESIKLKKKVIELQSSNQSDFVRVIIIHDLDIDQEDNAIISWKTYHLRPKKPLKIDAFSDIGIFKPVNIPAPSGL